MHPLNHGGEFQFDFGRAKFVNAIHSSTLPDGSNGGNPGGFVVESAEGNFYFSGDTALTLDMKLIGESTKLKFAALCVGDNFTMGPDDAVKAAGFVHCNEILGVHYDTFPPIKIDHAAAQEKFRAAGKTLHLLHPGETHDFYASVVRIHDVDVNARRVVHEKLKDVRARELPPAPFRRAEHDQVDVIFAAILQQRLANIFAFQHRDAAAEFGRQAGRSA